MGDDVWEGSGVVQLEAVKLDEVPSDSKCVGCLLLLCGLGATAAAEQGWGFKCVLHPSGNATEGGLRGRLGPLAVPTLEANTCPHCCCHQQEGGAAAGRRRRLAAAVCRHRAAQPWGGAVAGRALGHRAAIPHW